MARDTKQRILEAALEMFALKGYAGTNIRELSGSLELGKSSLYRHFESKEEIWDAVFEMMIAYYGEHFGTDGNLPAMPKSTDELYEMTMRMVDFTIRDEKVVKIRKIILTEQFRDERVRGLATRYFLEDTRGIYERVFGSMMDAGILKRADAGFLAFSYTVPITALVHLCDREPERTEETIEEIGGFVRKFIESNQRGREDDGNQSSEPVRRVPGTDDGVY